MKTIDEVIQGRLIALEENLREQAQLLYDSCSTLQLIKYFVAYKGIDIDYPSDEM